MIDIEIIDEWCKSQENNKIINIPEEYYKNINSEQAKYIAEYFNNSAFIKLPEYEIKFFEWMKIEDPKVWNDLWQSEMNEPYIVSVSFLPILIHEVKRGFPICDLLENTNYYFTMDHMSDEESKVYIETSTVRFMDGKSLTLPQLLALQISAEPIDIWHFAYKNKVSIEEAKQAAHSLVEDDALVHFKEAEYLAQFVDF